jgi:glutamate N-acetyltransferase/amino-acid N-acetyltransferase
MQGARRIWDDMSIAVSEGAEPGFADRLSFTAISGETVTIAPTLAWQPAGVRAVSRWIGVASAQDVLDFTVLRLDRPGAAAAVFTQSRCPSDAVLWDRRAIARGEIQLLCVISKNANVFSPTGAQDIEQLAAALSKEFDVPAEAILLCCTGIIGVPLPMERIVRGLSGLRGELRPGDLDASSRAILTTDRGPKVGSVKIGGARLCGFAKGAGMIEPQMATMLSYLVTDAALSSADLDAMLRRAVDRTFNAISVDSDTSTSDTVAILSTGEVELSAEGRADFEVALHALCAKLAREIVSQSEGAEKTLEVDVRVGTSAADARALGKSLLNSPLLKAAIHGADPNWGRIVMALGKPAAQVSFARVLPGELRIRVMDTCVFDRGASVQVDLAALSRRMREAGNVLLAVEIGDATHHFKGFGCALTEEYVVLNSQYTT